MSLPKFAAINLNSLPRMPYEQCGICPSSEVGISSVEKEESSTSNEQPIQALELRVSEMGRCLENISSRLEQLHEKKSYAEIVREKPTRVAGAGDLVAKGSRPDNGGEKGSKDGLSEKTEKGNKDSEWTLMSRLKRRKIETLQGKKDTPNLNLRGVETKKDSWDIYVGNLTEGSSRQTIQEYILEGGVTALQIYMLQSTIKGTVSARVRIPLEDRDKVLNSEFWPRFVKVRSWVFRPKPSQTTVNHDEVAEMNKID